MKSIDKNFFKRFMDFFTGSVLSSIISLISIPIITRLINPEIYGEFSLFILFYNIMCLFSTLGLEHSFIRFYMDFDKLERIILLRRILKIIFIFNILVFGLIQINSKQIIKFLNFKNEYTLFLLLFGVIIAILNKFAVTYLRILQKGKIYSTILVIYQILNILFIFIAIKIYNQSILSLIYPMIISNCIITLVAILSSLKYWSDVFFVKEQLSSKISLKAILSYSYPILLSSLIIWGYQSLDKIMLKEYSTLQELGLYTVSFRIVGVLNIIQQPFNAIWIPLALEKVKDKKFFQQINDLLTIVIVLIASLAILFSPIVIKILGDEYKGVQKIYPFLVMIPLLNILSEVTGFGIIVAKKTKYQTIISGVTLLLNFLLNYIFIIKYGALGAALSSVISYLIYYILKWKISNKFFYVKYRVFKPLVNLLLLVILIIINLIYNNIYYNLFIFIVIIIFTIIYYKDIKAEKDICLKKLKKY